MARIYLFILLAALSLVACDSGDERVLPSIGTLSATVTSSAGDSTTFSGNATTRFDNDRLQSVLLAETDETGRLGSRIVTFAPLEKRAFLPGTYSVGGLLDSTVTFTADYIVLSSLERLNTESGELTIEAVTETDVRGRFQFEATSRPFDPAGQTRYSVHGSFEALITRDPNGDR